MFGRVLSKVDTIGSQLVAVGDVPSSLTTAALHGKGGPSSGFDNAPFIGSEHIDDSPHQLSFRARTIACAIGRGHRGASTTGGLFDHGHDDGVARDPVSLGRYQ